MNRNINLFILSSTLFCLLFSCGRQAQRKQAPKSYLPLSGILSQSIEKSEIDPQMRALTFLIYPTEKDVEKFSYEPNEMEQRVWQRVLGELSYGDRVTQIYPQSMTGAQKVTQLVTAILSAGEAKDSAFKKIVPLKAQIEKADEDIKQQNIKLKKQISNFECFYEQKPVEGEKYNCHLVGKEGFGKKKLRSCRDLKKYDFQFSDQESEEERKWQTLRENCQKLDEQRSLLGQIKIQREEHEEVLLSSEGVVLSLLQTAEKYSGRKSFLAVGASKDKPADDETMSSRLILDPETKDIVGLELWLDFGPHSSQGSGHREYSTTNQKITNFHLAKRDEAQILKFNLETADFNVEAILSMTLQNLFDLRFVGDLHIRYPDKTTGKGVMKLEFDLLPPPVSIPREPDDRE